MKKEYHLFQVFNSAEEEVINHFIPKDDITDEQRQMFELLEKWNSASIYYREMDDIHKVLLAFEAINQYLDFYSLDCLLNWSDGPSTKEMDNFFQRVLKDAERVSPAAQEWSWTKEFPADGVVVSRSGWLLKER